jgi:hypothetical protein
MIGAIRRQASAVADPGERGRVVFSVVFNNKNKLDCTGVHPSGETAILSPRQRFGLASAPTVASAIDAPANDAT